MNAMDPQDESPPFSELVFVQESATLLDTADRAYTRMMRCLEGQQQAEFWEAVDQFLSVSIRVANIYWPSSNNSKVKRRGRQLRTRLSIGHDERFPGLRAVRNGFEHLDERIDTWADTAPHIYIDRSISDGAIGAFMHVPGGVDVEKTARAYRTDTGELSVFGASLIVHDLIAELRVLRAHLREVTGR